MMFVSNAALIEIRRTVTNWLLVTALFTIKLTIKLRRQVCHRAQPAGRDLKRGDRTYLKIIY